MKYIVLLLLPTKMPPYGDIFACTFNYFYCLLLIFSCVINLAEFSRPCQEYLYRNIPGVHNI